MAGRNIIVLGDTTTHNGTVISAWGRDGPVPQTIDGKPVACIGDKVTCPKCRGTHTIVSGASGDDGPRTTLGGRPVAREGDEVSDGSKLVSKGQSSGTHGDWGNGAATAAAAAYSEATAQAAPAALAAKGIQTASATAGISAEEARLLKEQANSSKKEEEKGYVTVFINNNGWALSGKQHASLFVGRGTDADRTLFDPCGHYTKGIGFAMSDPNHKISSRKGAVLIGDDFSYHDYYLFHRADGGNVNAFSFEITKAEEKQIKERFAQQSADTCWMNCAKAVSNVLNGIGPFKNFDYSRPSALSSAVRRLTKMSTSPKEKDVLNRMKGAAKDE